VAIGTEIGNNRPMSFRDSSAGSVNDHRKERL